MIQCDIQKERSYIACLRDAFDLMCANFAHIMRKTWWSAALLSVFSALTMIATNNVVITISAVASIAVFCLLYTFCMTEVVEGSRRKMFLRILKVCILYVFMALLFVLATVLAAIIMSKFAPTEEHQLATTNPLPAILITLAIYLVMLVIIIPTFYSSMKYFAESTTKLNTVFGKAYKTGWRNWGRLFIVMLLIVLIFLVVSGILSLPITVLLLAKASNAQGMMLGDASALPSGFTAMFFIAAAIASFINAYVGIWALFAQYLIYGHIETKNQKKAETPQE